MVHDINDEVFSQRCSEPEQIELWANSATNKDHRCGSDQTTDISVCRI
jgi:hypothetical protein